MTENGAVIPREPLPPEKIREYIHRLELAARSGKDPAYAPLSPGLIGANISAIEQCAGGARIYRNLILGYLFPGRWTDQADISSKNVTPFEWYAIDRWTGVWNDPMGEPGHKWPWHPALQKECEGILTRVLEETESHAIQAPLPFMSNGDTPLHIAAYDNGGEHYGTIMVLHHDGEKWGVCEHMQATNPELEYENMLADLSKKYPAIAVVERPNIFRDDAETIVNQYLGKTAQTASKA